MNLFLWRTARLAKDAEVEDAFKRQQQATQQLADALNAARGIELRELINALMPIRRKPASDDSQ